MPIEAILFDLGRVIVDLDMAPCEAALLARSDRPADETLRLLWDSGWIRRYETGQVTTAEFHGFLSAKCGLRMSYEEFRRTWSEVFDPVPILPAPLLAGLGKRYPMTLISNTNEAHAEHIRRNYDVFDHFAHHILSHEVGVLKPDPVIFQAAIRTTGHSPETTLFIDDRDENIAAARELGLCAHRFVSPDGLRQIFLELGVEADWPVSDPPR